MKGLQGLAVLLLLITIGISGFLLYKVLRTPAVTLPTAKEVPANIISDIEKAVSQGEINGALPVQPPQLGRDDPFATY